MDSRNKTILISYDNRKTILNLPLNLTELKQAATLKFSLNTSSEMIVQQFNEEWAEFIDVSQDDAIIPGCKYRIILQLPEILYMENSGSVNAVSNSIEMSENVDIENSLSPSPIPEDLQIENSFSTSRIDESSKSGTSINLNISLDNHLSSCLKETLKDKLPLSRVLRAELVGTVCRIITKQTKYPSSMLVTDAARKIIKDYPYLTESIGTGFGGWRQAIRDRLKNLRRNDDSEEVKCRKKLNKSIQKGKTEILVVESEFGQQNVSCDLDNTYEVRRNEIVAGKMKVNVLKTKYASLFSKVEFENEFCRITGKSTLFECVLRFLELYCDRLDSYITRKKLPAWAQRVKCILDESNENVQAVKHAFVLLTLPVHFSEEQIALMYSLSSCDNIKETGSASPHIAVVGLEAKDPKYFVLAEQEIVLQVYTIHEAIAVLIASYFIFNCEYPKQWKKTLYFMESFVFELDTNTSKIPCKVVNFVQKLKDSTAI